MEIRSSLFWSASDSPVANASTKYPPNTEALRSPPVRVAVITTRFSPDSFSTNGPLALAVLTNVTCPTSSRSSNPAKSSADRSRPGRLMRAVSAKLPWPNSTMTT